MWNAGDHEGLDRAGIHPRVGLPTTLIGIGRSKKHTYDKYGYAGAMRTQIDVGTFAYCGVTDVSSHLVYDVEGDHNTGMRDQGLDET